MKILGFGFTKISSERLKDKFNDLKVNTEVNLKDLKETQSDLIKTKETILEVGFNYKVTYAPDIATITVEGNMLLSAEKREADEILKKWKRKEQADDFRILVINTIIKKASLKAMQLEDDLNLPLHIPFPLVKKEDKKA